MSENEKKKEITRNDFLKIFWGTAAALVAIEIGGVTLAYMQPRSGEGEFGGIIEVGAVDTFPPGSVTQINAGRFYLSRLFDGGFLALYQRCTHLGCSVPWDQVQGKFICPCHNSQFTTEGDVENPPAPRALDLFPVIIEGGIIKVDTSNPVSRQNYDPSQVVYA